VTNHRKREAGEFTVERTAIAAKVESLAEKLVDVKSDDPHVQAVQAYCAFASEIQSGILDLVAVGNGAAAQSLVRTLFETIVGVIILAKHPNTLEEFEKHGRLTTIRLAKNMPSASPFSKTAKEFVGSEGTDYDALFQYFEAKKFKWHPFSQTQTYAEAELPDNFNNRFYARSSAISHGEPFVILEPPRTGPGWRIQSRTEEWKRWAALSSTMSLLFTVHMVEVLSRVLKLGLDSEVASVSKELGEVAQAEMKPSIDRLSNNK
jgi:hypothetical protein